MDLPKVELFAMQFGKREYFWDTLRERLCMTGHPSNQEAMFGLETENCQPEYLERSDKNRLVLVFPVSHPQLSIGMNATLLKKNTVRVEANDRGCPIALCFQLQFHDLLHVFL